MAVRTGLSKVRAESQHNWILIRNDISSRIALKKFQRIRCWLETSLSHTESCYTTRSPLHPLFGNSKTFFRQRGTPEQSILNRCTILKSCCCTPYGVPLHFLQVAGSDRAARRIHQPPNSHTDRSLSFCSRIGVEIACIISSSWLTVSRCVNRRSRRWLLHMIGWNGLPEKRCVGPVILVLVSWIGHLKSAQFLGVRLV